MSISGDSVIMRNGRTTSQVSIYNYPEHLNPFYEEDQHKRLRFWKVNKNADNERWKSISITSLKDLWPLKSFRLSKKKSSTLGVNKTSESPPILRRDVDHHYTPNRVSLQNEPYSQRATSVGFDRNNQYRSTIQVMGGNQSMPRYNYGRSVTPQPQRSNFMETPILNRRSGSRTSTTSTNPFEDFDDDEDVENYFHRGPLQTQSLMPTQRKKRRAPIPTALLNNHKSSESSSQLNNTNTTTTTEEKKKEESETVDESLNISNLASQIQDFVDTLDKRDEEEEKALAQQQQITTTPTKTNGTITPLAQSTPKIIVVREKEPVTTITTTTTKTTNKTKMEVKEEISIPEIKVEAKEEMKEEVKVEKIMPKIELEQQINLDNNKKVEKQLNLDINKKETLTTTTTTINENNININEQSRKNVTLKTPFILTTPPTPTPETPSPKIKEEEEPPLREIVIFGALTGPEKPKRSSLNKRTVEFLEQEHLREQQLQWEKELQQQREEEQAYLASRNFSKKSDNEQELKQQKEQLVSKMYTSTTTTSSVNYVNGESTGAIPRTREWKDSSLAPLQSSVPPEKRKSAKEIIESINRQQRLLKEAAERNMPDTKSSNGRLQGVIIYNHFQQTAINSNDLDNTQKQKIKNKREELPATSSGEFRDPQKLENGSPVFAKCRVYKENYPQRESSPTTSNLDWNPLPKPKRNKDISLD